MNALNYFIEANIGLLIFLAAYTLLLRRETDFKVSRLFLLTGIFLSIIFPLLHLQYTGNVFPTLSNVIPTYLLPGIVIVGDGIGSEAFQIDKFVVMNGWNYLEVFYLAGVAFFLARFLVRLIMLVRTLYSGDSIRVGNLKVVELNNGNMTFSFFNFIVLGQANLLSLQEKQKIIEHEAVHANRLHSLDILLLNVLGILFWFNPFLKTYKRIFVQLHEFEADARAVENHDVDEYCNLLARVALESAGLKLANHFNNSLTLKRIEMMRTIKRKIRPWKMTLIAAVLPLTFFIVSCQDQITNQAAELATSSAASVNLPVEVQQKYEALVKANPEKKFLVMETDENMVPKHDDMKQKFESLKQRQISNIEMITPKANKADEVRTFAIVEYRELSDLTGTANGDKVFTVVDEPATPPGGISDFYHHVMTKLTYPLEARQRGIEGHVFVEFVVNVDGSVSDINVKKGIGAGCDEAAVMAIKTSPKWNPGKQDGVAVKQRLVMPVAFKLEGSSPKDQVKAPGGALDETVVVGKP